MDARGACVLAAALAATGCIALAPEADYPDARPAALEAQGRALAVVGDLQLTPWLVRRLTGGEHNEREQARLVADLSARVDRLAALVLVGDLVFTAHSRRDWAHFDSLIGSIAARVPVLPVMGNHDYYCVFVELCAQAVVPRSMRSRFPWLAPGEPYSVAFGDVALLFLDTETALDAQAAWLSRRLDELESRFAAVVVFMHRAPYTDATDPDEAAQAAVRERFAGPITDAGMPRLVVSGHEHGYEHVVVDGVHFVISAGGGGSRESLRASRPDDVYTGRNCASERSGRVLRPFNYLLIRRAPGALRVTVRGLCEADEPVEELAAFELPLAP